MVPEQGASFSAPYDRTTKIITGVVSAIVLSVALAIHNAIAIGFVVVFHLLSLDHDAEWRPTAGANGFGNLRYASGWFRVAGGQQVRMYRAKGRRLVLLPGRNGGATILYELPHPETFIQEVRREWPAS